MNASYVIQHREPAGRILSSAELIKHRQQEKWPIQYRPFALWWLAKQARRDVAFIGKWLTEPPERSVAIDYDRLVAYPKIELSRVLNTVGLPIDDLKIATVVQHISDVRAGPPNGPRQGEPFTRRDPAKGGDLPLDLVAAYDKLVRTRCKSMDWLPSRLAARPSCELEMLVEAIERLPRMDPPEAEAAIASSAARNVYFAIELADHLRTFNRDNAAYKLLLRFDGDELEGDRIHSRLSRHAQRMGDIKLALDHALRAAAENPTPSYVKRIHVLAALLENPTSRVHTLRRG